MQTKLKKTTTSTILAMALLAFSVPSMARTDDACGQLSIMLASAPGHTCSLVRGHIAHGKLINGATLPPVLTNIPSSLQMEQAFFYGPDVELTYSCDQTKTITISTQQKYCALKAGPITTTSDSDETKAISTMGSALLGAHGSVSWVVR